MTRDDGDSLGDHVVTEPDVHVERRGCARPLLLSCGVLVVALAIGAWFLEHGVWLRHARAVSPDGQRVAVSSNRYVWAPIYGWSHYSIEVRPAARIRCKTLVARWRGTPPDLGEWKYEHHYATYNDFDGADRFPTAIRWLTNREFVIEGGEGGGSVFEIEP